MSNKYSQKLVDTAKKSGDLVGNKFADKITQNLVQSTLQVHQKNYIMKKYSQMKLIMKFRKRDIFLQKKGKKLLMN